ncbi:unnamed protein product, partial [Rotaria sp. Silwood2]
ITALFYQENVHYIVHDGLIKPVDYYSTGIVHSSSNWSDGLHQFLQLKHNLKMTSETFTTNFLSNIGYFKKYGSNLCGLTGTLGSEKARQDTVKSAFTHVNPSAIESNILLSIEEQWAMFLRKIEENSNIDGEKIHIDYKNFRQKIINDYKNERVIKNPYYHIIIGNDLTINDSLLNSKYDEAMKHFDRAIELDPNHCAAAFFGQGWLLLKGKKRIVVSNRQELGYKDAAIEKFRRALKILCEDKDSLETIQTLLFNRYSDVNTLLYKQLMQKANILAAYANHINDLISVIRKSQRLLQITEIIDYSNLRENNDVLEETILYEDIEKDNGKFCDVRLISSDNIIDYKIALLECQEILIMKDQAEFIVNFKGKKENKLSEWRIDDSKLQKCLSSLSDDQQILDRYNNSEIYNQIYEKVTSKNGYIRGNFLLPLGNLSDRRKYEVTFNDLTVRKDSGNIDQAIKTITVAAAESQNTFNSIFSLEKYTLTNDYQHIRVSLLKISSEILEQLLNPNIKIQNATKEAVLTQLKERSSFFHRH